MNDLCFQELLLRFQITEPVRDSFTTGAIDDVINNAINLPTDFHEPLLL
ncbi:hypothetical protein [uncultured Roseobacter sp.]|nr:hypothetical protein [uncultured Roseobacter sp.]